MNTTTLSDVFIQFMRKHKFKAYQTSYTTPERTIFALDLSMLRLRFSHETPLIEVPRQEILTQPSERIFQSLKNILLDEQFPKLPIVLVDGDASELKRLFRESPYFVAVLGEDDIRGIMSAGSPLDTEVELLSRVRHQIPLSFLSPYEVSAPVVGGQFFGREYETRTILQHPTTCYTVIGTRRLGKSSLLHELKRQMENEDPDGASCLLYFDCMGFNDTQDFYERVISALYPKEYGKFWRQRGGYGYSTRFPQFMHLMRKMHKRTITFFLDEVDDMLMLDRQQGYRLMRTLRACVMERSCRFIFAGFREVERELSIPNTPFNFTTGISLDNFHHKAATELITVPLENLGITIINKDQVVRRIIRETAGHPFFIQHYCSTLVKLLDETDTREITPDHLAKVADNRDFRMNVLDTFSQNTDDFEKAVVLSVAHKAQFTSEDLERELKKRHVIASLTDSGNALRKLEQLGIISRDNQGYKFVVPVLPQLVQDNFPGDLLFPKASEQLKLAQRAKV